MMFNEIDIQVKLAQLREMQSDAEWERIVNQAWRERPRSRNSFFRQVLAGLGRDMVSLGSYLEQRYRDSAKCALEQTRQPLAR